MKKKTNSSQQEREINVKGRCVLVKKSDGWAIRRKGLLFGKRYRTLYGARQAALLKSSV